MRKTWSRMFLSATWLTVALNAQDLGFREYLKRLDAAPGWTIEQKVEFLSNQGVHLSDQGLRDLVAAMGSAAQPWESRRARRPPSGGYRIESDMNPWESYTVRPRALGGYRIESDFPRLGSSR